MMTTIAEDWLIPLEPGQAVSRGWGITPAGRPAGVTWHWTATADLLTASRTLGGRSPTRKGEASAHYGVGRSRREGVHRYVSLEDRSWHAGIGQILRWDGQALTGPNDKGSRTTIGVETVSLGFARPGVPAGGDWIEVDSPDGRTRLHVQPWTDEQLEMMADVGREIITRFPHIRPEDHHGHSDLCPTYKLDVLGFPFAELLRTIYDDPSIPDVWTPLRTARQRQRVLLALGYDLGPAGVDDDWGRCSRDALVAFHRDVGLPPLPYWTTFTCRAAAERIQQAGKDLATVAGV